MTSGTALAPGTRTSDQQSPDITTPSGGRGALVVLDVTAAGGPGSITVVLQGKDPVSGHYYNLHATPSGVSAQGTYQYEIGPGVGPGNAASATQLRAPCQLPETWRVYVAHNGGSNWTYSVGYTITP